MCDYATVGESATAEIVIKRSRFLSHVAPVSTEEEALKFLAGLRTRYWDASHNVYAYALRQDQIRRYSDDGEPAGTSGIPTLEVIQKEGLVDVCVVTTRYFGGTLLGAGGLVRAYTAAAKAGIDAAGILRRVFCRIYRVRTEYTLLGRVQNAALELGVIAGEISYTDSVELEFFVPGAVKNFESAMVEASNGRACVTMEPEGRYIDEK